MFNGVIFQRQYSNSEWSFSEDAKNRWGRGCAKKIDNFQVTGDLKDFSLNFRGKEDETLRVLNMYI